MKLPIPALFMLLIIVGACNQGPATVVPNAAAVPPAPGDSLIGTWRLLNGTLIEKGDTVITDYTRAILHQDYYALPFFLYAT